MKTAYYFNMTMGEVSAHLQTASLRQHYADFCRTEQRSVAHPDRVSFNHYKTDREDLKLYLHTYLPSLAGKPLLQVECRVQEGGTHQMLQAWMMHLSTLGLVILDTHHLRALHVIHRGTSTPLRSTMWDHIDSKICEMHVLQAFDKGVHAADHIACTSILRADPPQPDEDLQVYLPSMMRDFELRPIKEQLRCLSVIAWYLVRVDKECASSQEREDALPVLREIFPVLFYSMTRISIASNDHPLGRERGVELLTEFLRLLRGDINVRLSMRWF